MTNLTKIKVLLIEDSIDDAELVVYELKHFGFHVEYNLVQTMEQMKEKLSGQSYDVVISDYVLQGFTGEEALKEIRKVDKIIPFILISSTISDEVAVKTLKAGAQDYIPKTSLVRLGTSIVRALEEAKIRRQMEGLIRESVDNRKRLDAILNNLPGLVIRAFHNKIRTLVYTSKKIEELTGYSESELLYNYSIGYLDIVVPEDIPKLNKDIKDAIKSNKPYKVEYRIRTKEGAEKWVMESGSVIESSEKGKTEIEAFVADITKRKQDELKIKEQEQYLQSLLENARDFAIIILKKTGEASLDLEIAFTSPSLQDLSGIGKNTRNRLQEIIACIDEEDRMRMVKENIEHVKPVDRLHEIFRYNHPKKGLRWMELQGRVIKSTGTPGENVYVNGLIRDITDHYKIQKEISESREKLSMIFDAAPFGISYFDMEGNFLDVNKSKIRMYGYSKEEFLQMNVRDLMVDKTEKTMMEIENQVKTQGGFLLPEVELYKKDGGIFIGEITGRIIQDDSGMPIGIVSVTSDRTEIIRENALKETVYQIARTAHEVSTLSEFFSKVREYISGFVNTKNFYVAFYDEKTDKLRFSVQFDEIDKYEEVDAAGTLSKEVILKNKAILLKSDGLKKLIDSSKIKQVGTMAKCWLGVPLSSAKKAYGILVVQSYDSEDRYGQEELKLLTYLAEQISLFIEIKRSNELAEERLNLLQDAKSKAEESDRLKSAFLSNMSHEIRTPMNAIVGFSQLLNDDDLEMDQVKEYAGLVHRNASLLLNLIEDIIDLSRIEAGEFEISHEECRVSTIVDTLISKFSDIITEEGKDIILNHSFDNPDLIVVSDCVRLRQVLSILLDNAIKFTIKGSVELKIYQEKNEEGTTQVHFNVIDTGIGIPDDKQDVIFERFRQVDDSHTRQFGGTGLGLSIARKITNLLKGRLWVDSETGVGSSFHLTIPGEEKIETKPVRVEIPTGEVDLKWPGKKVLIVEDIYSNYLFLEKALKNTDVNILWADNGEKAIEMAKQNTDISLVLLDLNLPGKNGYEVIAELKEMYDQLPVIAQTAYASTEDRVKVFENGFDDYISKPIKKDMLMKKINRFIGH